MIARTLWVVGLLLLCTVTVTAPGQQHPDDCGLADTVRLPCPIEVPTVVPGDSFRIPVCVWHDEPLCGFSVGFSYDNDYVAIESIDLEGSVLDESQRPFVGQLHLPGLRKSLVGWAPFSPTLYLQPTPADTAVLLFSLNMRVLEGAEPGWIDIDSTFVGPAGDFILSIDADQSAAILIKSITPLFDDCFNKTNTDSADVALSVREEDSPIIPAHFALGQNFPNPFNPTTTIEFALPRSSHVRLEVYNAIGQHVITLLEGDYQAGLRTVEWDGRNESDREVASGVYFYRIQADNFKDSKKMILLK